MARQFRIEFPFHTRANEFQWDDQKNRFMVMKNSQKKPLFCVYKWKNRKLAMKVKNYYSFVRAILSREMTIKLIMGDYYTM